ncbi:hypothetical protein PsYK624_085110 [Phanerochaete sordida]|uniref:Ubiquitin 3 binding protein But2 C-terminal domain-containing protein n=1 Tax=Phanerochaete sordida TaxID=48140 RepID=A0A9P3GCX8_9APHY|nr:hypothetical protein PsYK624_085110 [Phanerochaete sordida]
MKALMHEQEEPLLPSKEEAMRDAPTGRMTWAPSISPCLLVLAVIITVSDLCALAYLWHLERTTYADIGFGNLEFGDAYIGLDELYASPDIHTLEIKPIVLAPRVSAPVFRDAPDRLTPLGAHDIWSDTWGTTSPNERHLLVGPATHTVVQFRTIDFGMEDCELVVDLPAHGAALEGGAAFALQPGSRFDVFRVRTAQALQTKTLSWRTRPSTRELVTSVAPEAGARTTVARFPCPRGSLHTFEVACAGEEDCLVDVWSSHNYTWGMNIYQHQTV